MVEKEIIATKYTLFTIKIGVKKAPKVWKKAKITAWAEVTRKAGENRASKALGGQNKHN